MADYILIPDDIFELDRFLLADDEAKQIGLVLRASKKEIEESLRRWGE